MGDPAAKPPLLSLPWEWSGYGVLFPAGEKLFLTAKAPGTYRDGTLIVLAPADYRLALSTRDPASGLLRPIRRDDPVARAIEAVPDMLAALRPLAAHADTIEQMFTAEDLAAMDKAHHFVGHGITVADCYRAREIIRKVEGQP